MQINGEMDGTMDIGYILNVVTGPSISSLMEMVRFRRRHGWLVGWYRGNMKGIRKMAVAIVVVEEKSMRKEIKTFRSFVFFTRCPSP